MMHTQAPTAKKGAKKMSLSPARKKGKANISRNVPALPHQVTSIFLAPRPAKSRATRATKPSLTRANQAIQPGTDPSIQIANIPTSSMSRSAVGSKIFPNSLTWLNLRAIYPSTQSVAPKAPSKRAAAQRSSTEKRSHKKTSTRF